MVLVTIWCFDNLMYLANTFNLHNVVRKNIQDWLVMHIREIWLAMVIERFANIAQNGTILCSGPGDGGTPCKMFDYAHITGGCGFTRGFAAGAL